ncbi:MAG: site-specific integrase [Nitrospirae bacterium]|nr:site-specific integrase [Nitrospirota bacterium]
MAIRGNRNKGLYRGKNGEWGVLFFLSGRQHGPKIIGSRQDALDYMNDMKARHRKGLLGIDELERKKQLALEEACELYHRNCPMDLLNKRGYSKSLMSYFGGSTKIILIKLEAFDGYRNHLAQRKISVATIKQHLQYAKALWKHLFRTGYLQKNVLEFLVLPFCNDSRVRFLRADEELKLRDVLSPEDFRKVRFAILTGMRAGEIWNLRWDENVSFEIGLISLFKTKNGKPRHIPISEECRWILEKQKEQNSEWVFPSPSDPTKQTTHHNFMARTFRPALKNAGITNFRFHDLRHTCASRLIMAGVSPTVVRDILGHADLAMVSRYSHLSPEYLLKSVETLSNIALHKSNVETKTEIKSESNEKNQKITYEIGKSEPVKEVEEKLEQING